MKMLENLRTLGCRVGGVWLPLVLVNLLGCASGEAADTPLERRGNPAGAHGGLNASGEGPATSLSELLERAIFSEESKGDLEGALQIYREVIAEGQGAQALAAQAQYRVGVCLHKKRSFAEATAAFEKVAKDYPEQKELAALANQYLAGAVALLPVPWVDGEDLRFDVKFPTGFKVGMTSYAARAAEAGGRPIWRLVKRTCAGGQSFSRVEVEADSFQPIRSRWKHPLIGDVEAIYGPGRVEMKAKGKTTADPVELEGVVYDNEEVLQLIRRLPLAPGYTSTLRCLATLGGGLTVPIKLEVNVREPVETPAGKFECYRVETNIKQTFWYATNALRLLVKFEGGGTIAELAEIRQRPSGAPVTHTNAAFHFTLSAPADWDFYRREPQVPKGRTSLVILDPEAVGTSELVVQSVARLKPGVRKSVRDWAEARIAADAKSLKHLEVRAGSWRERVVAGRPGLSYIGDYVEGQEKMIVYGVLGMDETMASEFQFHLPAQDFEALRTPFDGIVDSYRLDQ